MIKAAAFLSLLASSLASNSSCINEPGLGLPLGGGDGRFRNETYLDIHLFDAFGDGWGTGFLALRHLSTIKMVQATCDSVDLHTQVNPCAHATRSGSYFLSLISADDERPASWWEIVWTVQVLDKDGNALSGVFTGGYNTTMVFDYDSVEDKWSLDFTENLITDFSCHGCTGGECKPKPKPKPSSKKKPKEKPEYGPPAVDLTVVMFSSTSDGWTDVEGTYGFGAHWYISSPDGSRLFEQGQLCSGTKGTCDICLGDGSYVFRVTGPALNETLEHIWKEALGPDYDEETDGHAPMNVFRGPRQWKFCNTVGWFTDQLNFHVKKGQCIPDEVRWADEICDETTSSLSTVIGKMTLSGVQSEVFDANQDYVKAAIGGLVTGWESASVMILSTSLDSRSLTQSQRALNTFTYDVVFSVQFKTEDMGVDGAQYNAVENLVSDIGATLAAGMSSGKFGSQLLAAAPLSGSADLFVEAPKATLMSLELSGIAYAGSKLAYYYEADSESDVSSGNSLLSMSVGMIAVLASVGVAAVIAVAGVVVHMRKAKYSALPAQSEHDSVAQSFMKARTEVSEVEMEYKRALPASRNTVSF
jgi:hypothetical protein